MSVEAFSFEEVNYALCDPANLSSANGAGTPIAECFTGSLHQPVSFPELGPDEKLVCEIDAGEYGSERLDVHDLDELVMCFNAFKYFDAKIKWNIVTADQ